MNKHIKTEIVIEFIKSCMMSAIIVILFYYGLFTVLFYSPWMLGKKFMNWVSISYLGIMVMWIILLCSFAGVAFFIFMKRMTSITIDISKITEQVQWISKGQFEKRIILSRQDELKVLGDSINLMAEMLKEKIEKEKEWNDQRYQMITNLSHDLKTPIMSIGGYVRLLQEEAYENESERERYLEIIDKKTKELNESINELFELSKISSSEVKIEKKMLNVCQFIEQVVMTFLPKLEESQMTFRMDIPKELMVYADPWFLKRISENLVNNAIKYGMEGKYLDISAHMVLEEKVSICFINYGERIPEEEVGLIFEKYYREKKNSGKEGSGCGLAIVKQMIHLLGGTIKVSSKDTQTVFEVILPSRP